MRRNAKRHIKGKKRKHLNNIVLQMEQDFKTNRSKEAHKVVNLFKKEYNPRTSICKKEGQLIAGKKKILDRWRDYFEQLLNPDPTQDGDQAANVGIDEHDDLEGSPTMEEIRKAVRKLKNNKGIDNIPGELIKYDRKILLTKLFFCSQSYSSAKYGEPKRSWKTGRRVSSMQYIKRMIN